MSAKEKIIQSLRRNECPARYERNMGTIGIEGQIRLLEATVGVAGCGGTGGYVIEMLARMGVGKLVVVDGDVFTESNLNRQLLCKEANIGKAKAQAAALRVAEINSAAEVKAVRKFIDEDNAQEIFAGCSLVIDALDSNGARKCVLSACRALGIPLVHGAIAGYWAQVAVFRPGETTFWDGMGELPDKGEELNTGNPSFTPAFAAALEVGEAVKILTGGDALKGRLLWYDLAQGKLQEIKYNTDFIA